MARAQATDFLHNMRFHVVVSNGPNTFLNSGIINGIPQAGFMSVTTPDVATNAAIYKEGSWIYERKYPGETTMGGDITMDRGVTRGDSSFWHWMRVVIEGSGEYRADLDIMHYHRAQALTRDPTEGGDKPNNTNLNLDFPARIYHVKEAFPTAHAVAGGTLQGTDGEITIMSVTAAFEHFEVEEKP